MIIKIINEQAEKRKEIEKIKELMNLNSINILLPKPYHFEELENLSIIKGKIFNQTIAELKLRDNIIEVYFDDEKDLEKLKNYFKDSKTKFRLIVGDNYY